MNVSPQAVPFLCLGLALALHPVAGAEPPSSAREQVLTLEDAVEIGIERSLALENARRGEAIAEERVREVRAQALPSLNLNSSYTRRDEIPAYPGFDVPLGRLDHYSASLDAEQLLYSGGSVSAALRAARHYRDLAVAGTRGAASALIRDVTKAFHDVLFAEAAVGVARESLTQLEDFERQTREKLERGTASEFDGLTAQVRVANERPKWIKARNDLALARAAFRNRIGLDDESFRLRGRLEFNDVRPRVGPLYELALTNRAEILQAESSAALLKADVRVARAEYYPEIRAFGSYAAANPDADTPAEDEWGSAWLAGIRATWSLLDGGLARAVVRSKTLQHERALAELEDLERNVRLEIESALLILQNAREVVVGSLEAVKLAEDALKIAKTRHEQGLSTYLEFTDGNLALSVARLTHYEALRYHVHALADLRYACGVARLPAEEERDPR